MNDIAAALEATLLQGWPPGALEVYADHLLSTNDPRGHLIAIDLRPRPADAAWSQRRRAILAEWIGSDLAWSAGHFVQHGFLNELRTGTYPPALLDSPAGAYVRAFTTFGLTGVRAALVQLAARPRPWLTRLTIANYGHEYLEPAEVQALIAATPRLTEPHLLGRPPFWSFHHRALQHARVALDSARVELSTEVTLVEVPPLATGPSVPAPEIARLCARVEQVEDCNVLYADTSFSEFSEPVPALVARLASAGLLELRGPTVRAVPHTPRTVPRPLAARGYLDTAFYILEDVEAHVDLIADCVQRFSLSTEVSDALADYCRVWAADAPFDIIAAERWARIAAAFGALFELQGLFAMTGSVIDPWQRVLDLARSATDRDVTIMMT